MDTTAVILAGGRGSRIGGHKALVLLGGRPLISYPIDAAQAAGLAVVVVAKATTNLPPLDIPLLLEPDEPTHPLLGIITALEHHAAVIAIPCDMPLLRSAELAALAAMPDDLATLWPNQPFPSLYRRALLPQLREALEANQPMRAMQAQPLLAPASATSNDSAAQISVNTAADVARAEALLRVD
ncbi:MAG: molybdenum cofactor guanylyltransferase [Solirubrobacteraceae bacterium]